jgi:uncharacterized protein YlaI
MIVSCELCDRFLAEVVAPRLGDRFHCRDCKHDTPVTAGAGERLESGRFGSFQR